jgi:copper(I)-binding protein
MKRKISLLLSTFLIFASPAFAGDIEIKNAQVQISKGPTGKLLATIVNKSSTHDKLLKVQTYPAGPNEFHFHAEEKGLIQTTKVGFYTIPAHGNLTLEEKHRHVKLKEFDRPLKVGDRVEVIFTFEHGGVIKLFVPVKEKEK